MDKKSIAMKKLLTKGLMSILVVCLFASISLGQNGGDDSVAEPVEKREFKKLDIFPAISYSPETNLTLGAIGIKYFDLSGGDMSTPISNAEFLGVYTLNKQIIFESRWEAFGPGKKWRTRGEVQLHRFPDRNYGVGNDANAIVVEMEKEGKFDTLNYHLFDSDRIKFSPVVLWRIGSNLYLGPQFDMEYLFNVEPTSVDYEYLNEEAQFIDEMAIDGLYSGLGIQLLFDSRDNVLNPLHGSLIEFNNVYYGKYVGSDFGFSRFRLDARKYLNVASNHTLGLRLFGSFEFTDDEIPIRALSRVGGHKFIRGYFKGTYQDRHLAAFEAEYRMPFWPEGTDAKLWQVWKRLGVVGFVSGAQVFHEPSDFAFDRFHFATGGGLRILFNPETRVNIRIDYAVGLSKGSDGFDKQQSGLYFYLGEAF